MARVPVATQGAVKNRAAPVVYQSTFAPAEAFGSAQAQGAIEGGKALSQASDVLEANALKIQIEDNERAAKDADIALSQRIRDITLGDGDKAGYYSTRGENAVSNYRTVSEELEAARREVGETITNPRVREMFAKSAANRMDREANNIARHVAKERRVANDATSEARLGEAVSDAAAHNANGKVIAQSKAIIAGEVADMAERNGWDKQVAAAKMKEALTAMHRSVIEAAVLDDPARAQAYYAANKDQIDGRVHADLEKTLEKGTLRQQSQAEADRIFSLGLSDRDALKAARDIADPKLRDEVVSRVSDRQNERERLRRADERNLTRDAWETIKGGGSLDDISPATLAVIPGTTLTSMRAFQNRRAKDGRGYAASTKPETYNKLHNLYMEDKLAFSEYDITKHLGDLDESDYEYWLSQQRTIDRAQEKEKAKNATYTLADKLAKEYMVSANIEYGANARRSDAPKAQKVFRLVREVVDTMHDEGQRATREDIDRALTQLFISGEVQKSGPFNDKSGKRFEFLGTDDQGNFVITDAEDQLENISTATGVPKEHILAIEKALKDTKKPLTLQNISDVWDAAKKAAK